MPTQCALNKVQAIDAAYTTTNRIMQMIEGVSLSLRLAHPEVDIVPMANLLGLSCKRSWLAGQPRVTDKGVPLEGVHESSYCACALPIENANYLEEGLMHAIDILKPHTKTLIDFSTGGGKISFFVSLEKGVFEGAQLSWKLLSDLGALHASVDIDRNL